MVSMVRSWFDSSAYVARSGKRIDWARIFPFIVLHISCLAVVWVGVSAAAVGVAVASYLTRMFAITGFYHRYFAHKAFKTSRPVQFVFALLGAAATQRGPLWWAAHHRKHHRHADGKLDPHRPADGLLWSHVGWFLCGDHHATDHEQVREWRRYPELVWLDRYDKVIPIVFAVLLFVLGAVLQRWAPQLETSGLQMLVWGYVVSTVALIHATLLVNSLCHTLGHRRFKTRDDSRNNPIIALLTLGEGWHNNHHRYAGSARQGFYWWQLDITYWVLRAMQALGLIWDVKPVPPRILAEGRQRSGSPDARAVATEGSL